MEFLDNVVQIVEGNGTSQTRFVEVDKIDWLIFVKPILLLIK